MKMYDASRRKENKVRRSFRITALFELSEGEWRTHILTKFDVVGDGSRIVDVVEKSSVYPRWRSLASASHTKEFWNLDHVKAPFRLNPKENSENFNEWKGQTVVLLLYQMEIKHVFQW